MHIYTEEELLQKGYKIENVKIKNVSLSMEEHGCFTSMLYLDGKGFSVAYGGYCLGKGYLGAKSFKGSAAGVESIMRIMDVIGVSRFEDLPNCYARVATKGWGESVKIIGNVIKDKWFDYETFFNDKNEAVEVDNVHI